MTYRVGMLAFDDRAAVVARSDRAVPLEPQPARALALLLSGAPPDESFPALHPPLVKDVVGLSHSTWRG
jgi:hypothetical protein